MIKYTSEGTKIDIHFEFLDLKLGVGFPCEIAIVVATNYEHTKTDPVKFDHQKFEATINKKLKTTVVLFPLQNAPIQINVVIKTQKGDKSAGFILFDIFSAINQHQFTFHKALEKCPDPKASLSFKFSYLNVRPSLITEPPVSNVKPIQNSVNSFYSAFNNLMDTSESSRAKINLNSTLNRVQKGRSQSPNNVKLLFNPQKPDPRMNMTYTSGRKSNITEGPVIGINLRSGSNINQSKTTFPFQIETEVNHRNEISTFTPTVDKTKNPFYQEEHKLMRASEHNRPVNAKTVRRIVDEALPANLDELEGRLSNKDIIDPRKSIEFKPKNFTNKDQTPKQKQAVVTHSVNLDLTRNQMRSIPTNQGNIVIDFEDTRDPTVSSDNISKIDDLSKALADKTIEVETLQNQILEKNTEVAKLMKEHQTKMDLFSEEIATQKTKVHELEVENGSIKEKLLLVNARKVDEAKMKDYEMEIKDLKRKLNLNEEEKIHKDDTIANYKQRLNELENQLQEGKGSVDQQLIDLENSLKLLKQQNFDLQSEKGKEIRAKDIEITSAMNQLDQKTLELKKVNAVVQEYIIRINQLEKEDSTQKMSPEILKQIEVLQSENKTYKMDILVAKKDLNMKNEELRNLKDGHRKELRELQDRIDTLQKGSVLAMSQNISNVEGFLLNEKNAIKTEDHKKAIDEYEQKIMENQTKIEKLEWEKENMIENSVPKQDLQKLKEQLSEKDTRVKTLESKIEQLKQEMIERDLKVQNLEIQTEKLKAMNHEIKSSKSPTDNTITAQNTFELEKIKDLENLRQKNTEQLKTIENLSKEKSILEKNVLVLQTKITDLEGQTHKLETNMLKVK